MWRTIVLGCSILLIVHGAWLLARAGHVSSGFPSSAVQRLTGIGAMSMGIARFLPDAYGIHDLAFLGGGALFLYGLYGLLQRKSAAEHVPPAV